MVKNTPIVFAFDDNLVMPAGVCISSLLSNANSDTFYDLYILHDNKATFPQSGYLERLKNRFSNFSISYINIGNVFDNSFEIRGISGLTYARLLIPDLIPQYDKIMYHDVDIIFRSDLTSIFQNTDLTNYCLAGVQAPIHLDAEYDIYVKKLGLDPSSYFYAGNIIINAKKIRDEGFTKIFMNHVKKHTFKYQDMDIYNIVCKNKIKRISPEFCMTYDIAAVASGYFQSNLYSEEELIIANSNGIVHYNGPKPWKEFCPNFDIWWEYYRNSIYFDQLFYFNFFNNKVHTLDSLPLSKRIKNLIRYFTVGKYQSND